MSGPKIPSEAKIKRDAQLEADRVKFENEKRLFIQRVASYENIAVDRLGGGRGSMEYVDSLPASTAGIQIPEHFTPTFQPGKYEELIRTNTVDPKIDLSWFTAPNLGLNYTQPKWVRPLSYGPYSGPLRNYTTHNGSQPGR